MIEDFITEKPHQFPGTKVNPEFVPEEGLDLDGMEDPFGLPWDVIQWKQRVASPYQDFDTYSLKSMIFKSDDDLRQELLAIQLMTWL